VAAGDVAVARLFPRTVVELTVTDKRVDGGRIRILLTPEVSGVASATYVAAVARLSGLATATIFRSEPGTLVQGRIGDSRVAQIDARGPCPQGIDASKVKSSYCGCGCNGPIMRRGMVAWAGGFGHGPDFFIFTGDDTQGDLWSHDHTVWGTLVDDESFATLDRIYKVRTAFASPLLALFYQMRHGASKILARSLGRGALPDHVPPLTPERIVAWCA
jgi:hypothetical protein